MHGSTIKIPVLYPAIIKWSGWRNWTGLTWLSTGKVAGSYKGRSETSDAIKYEEIL
jgi:hypothetical protein